MAPITDATLKTTYWPGGYWPDAYWYDNYWPMIPAPVIEEEEPWGFLPRREILEKPLPVAYFHKAIGKIAFSGVGKAILIYQYAFTGEGVIPIPVGSCLSRMLYNVKGIPCEMEISGELSTRLRVTQIDARFLQLVRSRAAREAEEEAILLGL